MSWRCARLGFFGRRLVGLMLDGSHHGKGEHDERDVTMPAVPGSGFVVVEPELVFGCLEAILDRPAMALDADQGLDRSPCRTPGGEVGEIAVGACDLHSSGRHGTSKCPIAARWKGHSVGSGVSNRSNCNPGGCLPSRIASTISGASRVSRRTSLT